MGSASSKFKKYLQHGDEFAAMQVCLLQVFHHGFLVLCYYM
jgi:hypothetical protein